MITSNLVGIGAFDPVRLLSTEVSWAAGQQGDLRDGAQGGAPVPNAAQDALQDQVEETRVKPTKEKVIFIPKIMNASFLLLYFTELKMPGVSLEEIQEEFADLDIDITDGDILSKLKVNYNPRGKNISVLSTLFYPLSTSQ